MECVLQAAHSGGFMKKEHFTSEVLCHPPTAQVIVTLSKTGVEVP
jgi:hypothetical protein